MPEKEHYEKGYRVEMILRVRIKECVPAASTEEAHDKVMQMVDMRDVDYELMDIESEYYESDYIG